MALSEGLLRLGVTEDLLERAMEIGMGKADEFKAFTEGILEEAREKVIEQDDEFRAFVEALEELRGKLGDQQLSEEFGLGDQDNLDVANAASELEEAVVEVVLALGDLGKGKIDTKLRAHFMRGTPYDLVIPTEPWVEEARQALVREIEERVRVCIRGRAN